MKESFNKILNGYNKFRERYAVGDSSVMQQLSNHGQKPQVMVVACCDSRVDPAVILQCDPGDLFVVRNVANIVPLYEIDDAHHGTSAALEFGVRELKVKHLILLGHSQCGGIKALLGHKTLEKDDFITSWVSLIQAPVAKGCTLGVDDHARLALKQSLQNCLTFPWIKDKVSKGELIIHLWFFDIKTGGIVSYFESEEKYIPLELEYN